jgi:hypothetical protein
MTLNRTLSDIAGPARSAMLILVAGIDHSGCLLYVTKGYHHQGGMKRASFVQLSHLVNRPLVA